MGYRVRQPLAVDCRHDSTARTRRTSRAEFDFWTAVNDHIIANSDDFYAYQTPTDFRLEHRRVELFHTGSEPPKKQLKESYASFLRFTSPVESPYPENNIMNARWFPARGPSRRDRDAAVERRRHQPQRSLPDLQCAGHFGAAHEHAVPRHSPPRGTHARRLRGLAPTSGAPSIRCGRALSTFAPASTGCSSADTPSWDWSAPAWARAMPSSPPPTIRASASTSSTTPRRRSAMWRGPASPPATSARASKRF